MLEKHKYRILVAVGEEAHLHALLALAVPLARSKKGKVIVTYVGESSAVSPPWLVIPEDYQDVVEPPIVLEGPQVAPAVLAVAHRLEPDLLLLHWRGRPGRGRYLLGATLDPLIEYAPCNVAVVRIHQDVAHFVDQMKHLSRILVPSGGGPNAVFALELALALSPEAIVTALRVASPTMGETAISAHRTALRAFLDPFEGNPRLRAELVFAPSVFEGIYRAAQDYDLVLIGATGESLIDRLIFGNLPQQLAYQLDKPLIIVRRCEAAPAAALRKARWRLLNLMPQLSSEEKITIYRRVRRATRASRDFYVLMTTAAGIVAFGLLRNSVGAILGAMVIAPIKSILIGLGLGITQGDASLVRLALRTLMVATFLTLIVSSAIGFLVPIQQLTEQMATFAAPNLLDLGIALLAGAAAAYASTREEITSIGVLPGVAVAVSLEPPLAACGLALAIGEFRASLSAFLLFLANLIGIVGTGVLMFLWMGFHPNVGERPRARVFREGVVGIGVVGLAVTLVLVLLTAQAVRESSLQYHVGRALAEHANLLGEKAHIATWTLEKGPISKVRIVVETEENLNTAQVLSLQQILEDHVQRPLALEVAVVRVERLAPRLPRGTPTK